MNVRMTLFGLWLGTLIAGCDGAPNAAQGALPKDDLLATVAKMDPQYLPVIEDLVLTMENGLESWDVADNRMKEMKLTPETMAAYRAWRKAMGGED